MKTLALPSCCLALVVGLAILSGSAPTIAAPGHDHERARAALQAGEVLPLAAIQEKVQRTYPGDMLKVELERKDGRWIYELKLLQADGALVHLDVDARTGEILKSKQRALPAPGRGVARADGAR